MVMSKMCSVIIYDSFSEYAYIYTILYKSRRLLIHGEYSPIFYIISYKRENSATPTPGKFLMHYVYFLKYF